MLRISLKKHLSGAVRMSSTFIKFGTDGLVTSFNAETEFILHKAKIVYAHALDLVVTACSSSWAIFRSSFNHQIAA